MIKKYVNKEFSKQYMINLRDKLRMSSEIIPKNNPFKVFDNFNDKQLKVVILGQDPYAGGVFEGGVYKDYYNGTAFGTDCKSTPYSLRVLLQAFRASGGGTSANNDLILLLNQGVLPINTLWSVARGRPMSHEFREWYGFTSNLLKFISSNYSNIVFILLGNVAATQEYSIIGDNLILKEKHPASHGRGGFDFIKTQVFNQANLYLKYHKKKEVKWAV